MLSPRMRPGGTVSRKTPAASSSTAAHPCLLTRTLPEACCSTAKPSFFKSSVKVASVSLGVSWCERVIGSSDRAAAPAEWPVATHRNLIMGGMTGGAAGGAGGGARGPDRSRHSLQEGAALRLNQHGKQDTNQLVQYSLAGSDHASPPQEQV